MNSTPETTATGHESSHVREGIKALVVAGQNGRAAAEVADEILALIQFGDELETQVFEALGAASTCWESLDGTGVFDSTRAKAMATSTRSALTRHPSPSRRSAPDASSSSPPAASAGCAMSELLDGSRVPWHIVSGKTEPGIQPDPLVRERVLARRAASTLPPPVVREPQPSKRLVAGGLFVAGALAAHWRRGRS